MTITEEERKREELLRRLKSEERWHAHMSSRMPSFYQQPVSSKSDSGAPSCSTGSFEKYLTVRGFSPKGVYSRGTAYDSGYRGLSMPCSGIGRFSGAGCSGRTSAAYSAAKGGAVYSGSKGGSSGSSSGGK